MKFIERSLPAGPARVLDVGCGTGELADSLRGKGYDVTAIDIDPALESSSVQIADIGDYHDEPFDAVIFSLSFHHVRDVGTAVNQARSLLRAEGILIVDEFAWERADQAIADAFYGEPDSLVRWRADHGDLNPGHVIIDAICARFRVRSLRNVPYLYRYLEDDSAAHIESALGFQLTALPESQT
jgi:SAM-dependent methyltransferase